MEINSISLNQRVENIKGNNDEINKLLEEYKPFIASVVEGAICRYVRYGEDDELSIGLISFEEAIRVYDISKGNFLAFARNVIKRRLIDYYRKEKKHNKVVQIVERHETNDGEEEIDNTIYESIRIHTEKQISECRLAEIQDLKNELSSWGLTFFDVAQNSPKQEGTRKIYKTAIDTVVNNPSILNTMIVKKYLPINEIEKISKIPRKKIERARNYIVAVVLIMIGDYEYLKDFIDWRWAAWMR